MISDSKALCPPDPLPQIHKLALFQIVTLKSNPCKDSPACQTKPWGTKSGSPRKVLCVLYVCVLFCC